MSTNNSSRMIEPRKEIKTSAALNEHIEKPIKPFIRWAGGKTWLTKRIVDYIPDNFSNYIEPFLGGGSVFFYLKCNKIIKRKAYLSDTNSGLIEAYKVLRDNPKALIKELRTYKNNEEEYYKFREITYEDPIREASRFIFLNRTSFNGIYRENLNGVYNVPYGHKKYKALFDYDNFLQASRLLQGVILKTCDFAKAISNVKENDLVFLDPPYTIAHENNGFVKYNQKIFSWDDQIRLKEAVENINSKKAFFVLTNAYHKSIRDLYQNIGVSERLERFSVVGGSNAKRDKFHEIIISNV